MNDKQRLKIWDKLQKQIIINQLPDIKNKLILDFGAGDCLLPHLMDNTNKIICIEKNLKLYETIYKSKNIKLLNGDENILKSFKDESFDMIICHNVFEYMSDSQREKTIEEFCRILKKNGFISFIKHNKFGRILEQILYKNNFANYKSIYLNNESFSERFGQINYFKDNDLIKWSNNQLMQVNKFGLRMFYDLQTNLDLQISIEWQKKIIDAELFFCKETKFVDIAFLHHLILIKK